jgi:hypothetical protein
MLVELRIRIFPHSLSAATSQLTLSGGPMADQETIAAILTAGMLAPVAARKRAGPPKSRPVDGQATFVSSDFTFDDVLEPISIRRGLTASGTSRTRSIERSPFSRWAPATRT